MRPYIARGVTILTTEKDAAFVSRIADAPHTMVPDALARQPRPPRLETFRQRRVLSDARNRIELIEIGPNSHADSMIVAWLPRQKILFQGDLLNLPDAGDPAPGIQLTIEGLRAIERLKLAPAKIAGVHGEVGTIDDWKREVAAATERR